MQNQDCGCKDKQNPGKSCGCWKKWLWIGLGITVVAVAGYFIWKKYRTAE